jgi:hypothetical protein
MIVLYICAVTVIAGVMGLLFYVMVYPERF